MSGSGYSASVFKRSIGLYGGRLLACSPSSSSLGWPATCQNNNTPTTLLHLPTSNSALIFARLLHGLGHPLQNTMRFRLHAPERLAGFACSAPGCGQLLSPLVPCISIFCRANRRLSEPGNGREVLRPLCAGNAGQKESAAFSRSNSSPVCSCRVPQASQLLRNAFMRVLPCCSAQSADWRTANALALVKLIASTLSLTLAQFAHDRHLRTCRPR